MEIYTQRCLIRRFQESELASFMAYHNDLEWMRYQGLKGLTKQAYADILLSGEDLPNGVQLAIINRETGETGALLGDIYLKQADDSCWLGYSIRRTEARHGYAFEAVSAVIQWLKEQGITTIKAEVARANLPSLGLLKKLNFIDQASTGTELLLTLHL
ncbi:GNAT family N-acetyltransferase [Lapidilactobacillus salsurivasis]